MPARKPERFESLRILCADCGKELEVKQGVGDDDLLVESCLDCRPPIDVDDLRSACTRAQNSLGDNDFDKADGLLHRLSYLIDDLANGKYDLG